MSRKLILLISTCAGCLLLWSGWVKGVRAEDFTLFLPLVFEESLRGDIVFYQTPHNNEAGTEIMKLHLPNRTITQLTQNAYFDADPAWSPDGTQIAYSGWPNGNGDIFVMNADGSNPTPLTATTENDAAPAWSPDGNRLVFTREFTRTEISLFLLTLPALQVTRLTTGTVDYAADWSPDGQRLAFSSARDGDLDLYVMNLGSMTITQVTQNDYVDSSPVWSPDGTKLLAHAQGHSNSGQRQLYTINADGTQQQFLPVYSAGDYDWSPDGASIVYDASDKFSRELVVWRLAQRTSEFVTSPDAPIFENSLRNRPQWYQPGHGN